MAANQAFRPGRPASSGGKSGLSTCRLKLAEFAAKAGNYRKAIDIFEAEGRTALQNNLKKYLAKDHFFKAGILHLVVGDIVTCKLAHESYCAEDPKYESSREGQLYAKLYEAVDADDHDGFVNCLGDYNDISPLEPWYVTYLMIVKEPLAKSAGKAPAGASAAAAADDFDLS